MLIDWFTVGAQAVNFLILVWLLKRFLYGPILQAMADRQAHVAGKLEQAEAMRKAADEERQRLAALGEAAEAERKEKLVALQKEIDGQRQVLVDRLRGEMDSLRSRWKIDLEREQKAHQTRIAALIRQEVFALSRQLLGQLAEAPLEDLIATVFLRRLGTLPEEDRARLAAVLGDPLAPLQVRSSFEASSALRQEILDGLGKPADLAGRLVFTVVPEVVCGIELQAGSVRISWSVADSLASFDEHLQELIRHDQRLPS